MKRLQKNNKISNSVVSILFGFVTFLFSMIFPPAIFCAAGDIILIAGDGNIGYSGDNGPATSASLYSPRGVALDHSGNIYIADTWNHRIRKVDKVTGVITTVAGNGSGGYSGDNGPATSASLDFPFGIALDSRGNIYIADEGNHRIRKVNKVTGVITTVAGNGTAGYSGDNGPATSASLSAPYGVAVDSIGNLYIADTFNNCVRKVDTATGVITTLAGNGTAGYSGDNGPAASATLYLPISVAVDSSRNIFVADTYNHRIRKVDRATGVISTVAGDGNAMYAGDNGPATSASLYFPWGVSMDFIGNIYIADTYNNRIRKVDGAGVISTVAGDGNQTYAGDNGPATSASLYFPCRVIVDAPGNIYIADSFNQRIRKVLKAPPHP